MSREKEYSINHSEQLYQRFLNLALNRFTWVNLPYGITPRKIEEYLIKHGQVMLFEEQGIIKILPCFGTGAYDIYNEPIFYNVVGNNYNNTLERDEGVVIRNNSSSSPDEDDLRLFAERINEVEQTMDINLNGQKTPFVILCDEKQRLTFKNILSQVMKYKYAIFGSKNLLGNGSVEVLQTKSEYLLDSLQEHKNSLMNELLTFLGINNNNVNKKERLVVDEVNANNDFILVNIDHMYDERKNACELINEKFGLNIKVEKRSVNVNIHNGVEENTRDI